jgi:uracil-DNA glycosylase
MGLKMKSWDELSFWKSDEWRKAFFHLRTLDVDKVLWNPGRKKLFAALRATPFEKVRVMIIGQDPYFSLDQATGIAFEMPEGMPRPPTLKNILRELYDDLLIFTPDKFTFKPWTDQGVLMWNAIPSVELGKPLSHNWEEWKYLTRDIIEELDQRDIIFVFLGSIAGSFEKYVTDPSRTIVTSHPSPRGNLNSTHPFLGSRIFSTINIKLKEQSLEPINWQL